MATPSGHLATALAARDVDAAVAAFNELRGQRLDARTLAQTCDLCARNRRNQQAWDAFETGRDMHGVPKLIAAGCSLNALLYACCREATMLDKAMSVWGLMEEHSVKPDAEPAEKLLLANLARHKYDDAFAVFLGAIDAELQPSAPACTALVRTCAVMPRLAQSAYAVQLTMKNAGMELPTDLLGTLLKACLQSGTAEQCLAIHAELEASGAAPPDATRVSKLAIKCAETPALVSKGAELLAKLRAQADAAGSSGGSGGVGVGSAAAYEAVLAALTKAAFARTNPATTQAAHAVGWPPIEPKEREGGGRTRTHTRPRELHARLRWSLTGPRRDAGRRAQGERRHAHAAHRRVVPHGPASAGARCVPGARGVGRGRAAAGTAPPLLPRTHPWQVTRCHHVRVRPLTTCPSFPSDVLERSEVAMARGARLLLPC